MNAVPTMAPDVYAAQVRAARPADTDRAALCDALGWTHAPHLSVEPAPPGRHRAAGVAALARAASRELDAVMTWRTTTALAVFVVVMATTARP